MDNNNNLVTGFGKIIDIHKENEGYYFKVFIESKNILGSDIHTRTNEEGNLVVSVDSELREIVDKINIIDDYSIEITVKDTSKTLICFTNNENNIPIKDYFINICGITKTYDFVESIQDYLKYGDDYVYIANISKVNPLFNNLKTLSDKHMKEVLKSKD